MPDIYADAARFLAEAANLDAYAIRRVTVELGRVLPGIVAEAERTAREYVALQDAGAALGQLAAFRVARAREMARRVEAEIARIMATIAPDLDAAQARAVEQGRTAARALVESALPDGVTMDLLGRYGRAWTEPPLDAFRAAVAAQQPGTPLRALLDAIGPDVSRTIRTRLNAGLLAGQSPRTIGRAIARDTELAGSRAELIARTETLRSYRIAQQVAWSQNPEIVPRFRRLASFSKRTCAACLSLSGTIQQSDRVMPSHPACRCVAVPMPDLPGVADTPRESGAEWLARQDEPTQRAILGPGALARYQAGTPLASFAAVGDDPVWGPTVRVRSLKEVA